LEATEDIEAMQDLLMEVTPKKVETKANNIIMAMVTKEVTKEETQ